MEHLITIIFGLMCIGIAIVIAAIYDAGRPHKAKRYNHSQNHPGITEKTLTGNYDIICPKCKCPYCMYVYEKRSTPPVIRSKTRTHLLNPFKPLVEEKIRVYPGMSYSIREYQCKNCGWIFK